MRDKRTRERLEEQLSYYRARAAEYDEWWLRRGRYDRGSEHNQRWFAEAEELLQGLRTFNPTGRVLELACGTGLWTEHLVEFADEITAVDASPEMLAIARERVGEARATYLQADILSWHPGALYDVVFFSFWLSHVPPERFAPFWDLVRSCLAPGGRVFFIDSLYSDSSTAIDHRLGATEAITTERRLNDGREFEIFKVFYRPDELAARLAELGWVATVRRTATYFLHGFGSPRQS
jgi:demethylmenaquinone methyltransferase/2-methoxy-6-polyprenyl-1,4-benzoquinol methylase